jgi:YVTN family beta-propeller protein
MRNYTMYVVNSDDSSVTPIWGDMPLTPIEVGADPVAITIYRSGDRSFAYVVNELSASVTPINTSNNEAGTAIDVGQHPVAIATDPVSHFAYVVNQGSNSVTTINTSTNQAVSTFTGLPAGPVAIAISANGRFAYVVSKTADTVTLLLLHSDGELVKDDEVDVGLQPVAIALPAQGSAYVLNYFSDTVSIIKFNQAGQLYVSDTLPVGRDPNAITTTASTAYVTLSGANEVLPINLANNEKGDSIPAVLEVSSIAACPAFVVGKGPCVAAPRFVLFGGPKQNKVEMFEPNKPDGPYFGVKVPPVQAIAILPNMNDAMAVSSDGTVTPIILNAKVPVTGSAIKVGKNPTAIAIMPVQTTAP